jgi:hypothetical protein
VIFSAANDIDIRSIGKKHVMHSYRFQAAVSDQQYRLIHAEHDGTQQHMQLDAGTQASVEIPHGLG